MLADAPKTAEPQPNAPEREVVAEWPPVGALDPASQSTQADAQPTRVTPSEESEPKIPNAVLVPVVSVDEALTGDAQAHPVMINTQAKATKPEPVAQALGAAVVKRLSSHVPWAAISDEQNKRRPGRALPAALHFEEGVDLLTVYFFTEYQGLKRQWVYHDWYRNGKREARVRLRPHLDEFSTFSSKYIDRNMRGAWQVKVVTEKDEVLAQAEFKVM